MEITTLEQYIVSELERKDAEIIRLNNDIIANKIQYEALNVQYNTLLDVLRKHIYYYIPSDYDENESGCYGFGSIYKRLDESNFSFLDGLFKDIREDEEYRHKQRETVREGN